MSTCWCRKAATGDMVCCDECDEWFHYKCIGIQNSDDLDDYWYCFVCQRTRSVNQKLSERIDQLERKIAENRQCSDEANGLPSNLLQKQLEESEMRLQKSTEKIKFLEEKLESISAEAEKESISLCVQLEECESKLQKSTEKIKFLEEKLESTSAEAEKESISLCVQLKECESKLHKSTKQIKFLEEKLESTSAEAEKESISLCMQLKECESKLHKSTEQIKFLEEKLASTSSKAENESSVCQLQEAETAMLQHRSKAIEFLEEKKVESPSAENDALNKRTAPVNNKSRSRNNRLSLSKVSSQKSTTCSQKQSVITREDSSDLSEGEFKPKRSRKEKNEKREF